MLGADSATAGWWAVNSLVTPALRVALSREPSV